MGYTHYWYVRDLEAAARALPLVAADLRRLLPSLPPLAGWDGQGSPVLEEREVAFNGLVPDDYETFRLEARPEGYRQTERGLFGFCKTGRHPYDLAVQAALALLKWHRKEPTGWLEELHRHRVIPFSPPFRLEGLLEGGPPGRPLEQSSRIYLNA